ncbi:MAG: chemotaxis protein CheW [Mariprofundus sp.]|nr:chemotaxis protein CheW [Mariprofundus sp.]
MDEELLVPFLVECSENMESIEEQLMELEANPQDEDLVNALFRVIHTVKGSCGFIGLKHLEKVAHAGENLLGKIRSLKYEVNADIVSLLLDCADAINELLVGIETDRVEPDLDHSALIERLKEAERLVDGDASGGKAGPADGGPVDEDVVVGPEQWLLDYEPSVYAALQEKGWCTPAEVVAVGFALLRDSVGAAVALKILGVAKAEMSRAPAPAPEQAPEVTVVASDVVAVREVVEEKAPAKADKQLVVKEPKQAVAKGSAAPHPHPSSGGSIRVDVGLLDSLMNQVGELVLTRNRLLQMISDGGATEFTRVGREIDQVTERLQSQLLRTRMQPIKTIWGTVPRVVRDMCKQLDKKIHVEMVGEDTELDRTILNAIKDPLTHILRNSCDHGIELPARRRENGKPETGILKLTAAQESGHVVIAIEDDGAGIPAAVVKNKALKMGVISEAEAAQMSDHVALQLIFHAGLSTAEKVSNFSGRGVGMDVVRTEIEKVGGSVDISSKLGAGTTLRIRMPLTLAIITAMIVTCRERRFAVPQTSIRELISAPGSSDEWRMIGGAPFFRLRGRLLPVLELASTLRLDGETRLAGSIIVIDAGDRTIGLLVDSILGAEEIVAKPLGVHFQALNQYGGCSILGDGAVIPILDCNGLAKAMQQTDEVDLAVASDRDKEVHQSENMQHVLLFVHAECRYAIPMALVERLEKFAAARIELSGSCEVLQYRDNEVIPVLRWGEMIGRAADTPEQVYGIILSDGNHRMCLQVNDIEGILEVPLDIKKPVQDDYFLGTAIIEGKVAEVVDVFDVITKAVPDWFNTVAKDKTSRRKRILFVEDTLFFRNLVIPVLESMAFEVWTAIDGEQACETLETLLPDIILTDIEMPKLDGYGLARWIHQQPHLKGIPLIALTATPPAEDDEVRQGYFNDIVLKFDRHSLVEHLQQILLALNSKEEAEAETSQITPGEAE